MATKENKNGALKKTHILSAKEPGFFMPASI